MATATAVTRPSARHLAILMSCCFVLSGCGSHEMRGRVAGTVTFQGKAVPEGLVVFSSDEKGGVRMTAAISSVGGYEVLAAKGAGIPTGNYKVAVCPPPMVPSGVFDPGKVKAYPNIPEKYRSHSTSGLMLTVKEGDNRFDIEMTP
jgi:hypothetical protein